MYHYQLLHNLDAGWSRGWRIGDRLVEGWTDTVEQDDVGDRRCDVIWSRHNADHRPDGQLAPSLSVGDVIILMDDDHVIDVYGVMPIGFAKVRRTGEPGQQVTGLLVYPGPYRDTVQAGTNLLVVDGEAIAFYRDGSDWNPSEQASWNCSESIARGDAEGCHACGRAWHHQTEHELMHRLGCLYIASMDAIDAATEEG